MKQEKKQISKPLKKILDFIKKPIQLGKKTNKKQDDDKNLDDIDSIIENTPEDVKKEIEKCGLTIEQQSKDVKEFMSSNEDQNSNNNLDDEDNIEDINQDDLEDEDTECIDESNSNEKSNDASQNGFNPDVSFFYTSEKTINAFEDDEIIKTIQEKFPLFLSNDVDDIIMRKTIIEILNDTSFMKKTLKYYDMNIFDFIKFLYRKESSLFKGQFIKRIQKTLRRKKYVIEAKKQAYRYSIKHKRRARTTKKQR